MSYRDSTAAGKLSETTPRLRIRTHGGRALEAPIILLEMRLPGKRVIAYSVAIDRRDLDLLLRPFRLPFSVRGPMSSAERARRSMLRDRLRQAWRRMVKP